MLFRAVKHILSWRVLSEDGAEIEEISQFLVSLTTRGMSLQTVRAYAFDLACFYNWLFERTSFKLKELDKYKLHAYIRYLQNKKLAPRTINRRLITASCFYRFHLNQDLPSGTKHVTPEPFFKGQANPWMMGIYKRQKVVSRHIRVKVPRKIIKPLNTDEVICFLKSMQNYRDLAIVKLMLRCGLRSIEVLGLKASDINILDRQLIVRGKGNQERKLPVPSDVLSTIHKYVTYERPKESQDFYLFVILKGSQRGKALTPEGLRKIFRYKRKTSGISAANPHRFRHTFASEMIRGKLSAESLRKLMGHSDIRQTMDYVNLDMSAVTEEFEETNKRLEILYEDK